MYNKNICRIRNMIEIEKYYPGNYGAPGEERQPKKKKTPEQMEKQNRWKRKKYLQRLMMLNFEEGDWHIVLRISKENRLLGLNYKNLIRKFVKDMRREYKKQSWILKYIYAEEFGKKKNIHWHIVLNNKQSENAKTVKIVRKLWTLGSINFAPLWPDYDYEGLADYFLKETEKRSKEEGNEKLCYTPSRNLIKPKVRRKKVDAKRWKKEPRAPKGWYIVKDSVVNGKNKFTGQPYQHYTMKKLEQKGAVG